MNPWKIIRKAFLNSKIVKTAAQLAAARESLEEAEHDYTQFYPSDNHVETILGLRKTVRELQEKMLGLQGIQAELDKD